MEQGESNEVLGQNATYTCRFGAMVRDWSERWHNGTHGLTQASLPFGFVQIGPACGPDEHTFATRIGQAANRGVAPNSAWPSTFMAAALDLPNTVETGAPIGGVHLMDKRLIAHRLALAAQGTVYSSAQPAANSELVWAGPRFQSIEALGNHTPNSLNESGRWLLTFDISMPTQAMQQQEEGHGHAVVPAGATLKVNNQGQGVSGFEIANGCYWGCMWVPAPVVEVRPPNQVVIETFSSTDDGANAVRYAYADTPCPRLGCLVYNEAGLPLTPFYSPL